MKETIYTINGVEYTRSNLLAIGKEHYPQFYWIRRGVGIGLIMLAVVVLIIALSVYLPQLGATHTVFIVSCAFCALTAVVGLVLIIWSFKPYPDDEYIAYAEAYLRKQNKRAEKTNKAKESENIELLIKYKKLLDEGIITQEEFENKKKELL